MDADSQAAIRRTAMVPNRARHTAVAPRASYQAYDAYRSAATRPTSSNAATAMADASSHRRSVISEAHALLAEPAFHFPADLREPLLRLRLVPGDDHRLGVRRADQSPAVAEQDAHTVDVDDIMLRAE